MRAANVTWEGLSLHDVKEMDFSPREFEVYRLRPGDILLSEASGSASEVGKPALWRGEVEGACFQNTLLRVRCNDTALAPFLHLRFQDDARNGRFARAAKGVGIHHLGAEAMSGWQVGVAPLAEQRRIVAEIERQFTRLDAAVATLEGVRAKLKRARASVLKAAVEGRLVPTEAELARQQGRSYEPAPALLARLLEDRRRRWPPGKKFKPPVEPEATLLPTPPEGWACAAVDQALAEDLANGRSVPTMDDGFPVLRLSALEAGRLNADERKGGAWTEAEARPFLVQQGDFLIARGNGSLNRVGAGALVRQPPDPVAFPDTMIRLRFDRRLLLPEFAALAWQSPALRRQIEKSARTTAGIFKVNQDSVAAYGVPLPPLAEQQRIVAEVERRLSVLDALERTVEQNLARCARLRQSILKRAFEGRLVPQDPTDEPASALLARLRDEAVTPTVAARSARGPQPARSARAAATNGGRTRSARKQASRTSAN
jgi:type I restriction enzyme S subunit